MNGQRRLLQALLGTLVGGPARQPLARPDATLTVMLGDTPVQLLRQICVAGAPLLPAAAGAASGPRLRLINLHENEATSVQAASAALAAQPGELIALHAQGQRLVRFFIGWRPHVFDPNRIFTDAGLDQTLSRHASSTPAARAAVRGLRDAVLALLAPVPPGGAAHRDAAGQEPPVVALHNTRVGSYSLASYQPGAALAGDAQRLACPQPEHSNDFFLVTGNDWFEALSARGFNAVLQAEQAADDGSLSVWFAQQGRPYINVEAGFDRLDSQTRMLEAVLDLAPALLRKPR